MKPVLRTVVDKNGAEETVFTPTAKMILYGIYKARNQHLGDGEVCDMAKIDRQLPMRWKVKFGTYFTDWLEQTIEMESGDDALVLERFGMMQALQPGNYQYFRDLARSKGVIKEEESKKSLTINTDFTVILQASGGDLHAVRDRLLQAARGLEHQGGSRVVESHRLGKPEGAGGGAGDVQGEPVAVANALGADRGRAERTQPIPAVPEQDSFASTYRVLDEGEVFAGAKESSDDGDLAL